MSANILSRRVMAVVLGAAALGAVSAAQARSDVFLSIGVNTPGAYVQPAPVYVQPAPVYVQPAPVYVQPRPIHVQPAPVYVQPRPVYVQPAPVYAQPPHWGPHGYGPGHGHGRPHWHGRGSRGDWDQDGVPNRWDRYPSNPNWR